MIKKLFIIFAILAGLGILVVVILVNTGPQLPREADRIITEVLDDDLPELVMGETGMANSDGVKIWYETISESDTPKAAVLLVMGHSSSAMLWPEYFIQPLLDQGYQVIRYDNRGLGLSDWMEDWEEHDPYTLEDMAKDGVAVLDAVGIEKAHIVGVSMGGMIAQRMAISHSDRVLTLCSIMSSGYFHDPELSQAPPAFISGFVSLSLRYGLTQNDRNAVKLGLGVQELLKGSGEYRYDIKRSACRVLYEMHRRKGFNPAVGDQHTAAIVASGSRYEELGSISVPTLIIHGKADPLISIEHSEKYAPMIPQAKTLWLEGMGHDLPEVYMDQVMGRMIANFEE